MRSKVSPKIGAEKLPLFKRAGRLIQALIALECRAALFERQVKMRLLEPNAAAVQVGGIEECSGNRISLLSVTNTDTPVPESES